MSLDPVAFKILFNRSKGHSPDPKRLASLYLQTLQLALYIPVGSVLLASTTTRFIHQRVKRVSLHPREQLSTDPGTAMCFTSTPAENRSQGATAKSYKIR